jgi:response regulator of citrate/malate metabolism
MTASAIQGDREKCLDAGMNNYLAKPVRALTLKTLLESYLNKESEEKEIPNLQVEAKKIVKDALSETDHGVKKGLMVDEETGEKKTRSRPVSVRSSTQRWLGPNGKDGKDGMPTPPPS